MGAAGHSFDEHTGEVLLRLHAPSLGELFRETGRALAELQAIVPPEPGPESHRLEVRAPDREALLVEWIDELIFLSEREKKVFTAFDIERLGETELAARVRGGEPEGIRTAVKAATFHRLRVEEGPEGWSATVVLDV